MHKYKCEGGEREGGEGERWVQKGAVRERESWKKEDRGKRIGRETTFTHSHKTSMQRVMPTKLTRAVLNHSATAMV